MLVASGHFIENRVDEQMGLIRGLVEIVPVKVDFDIENWGEALKVAAEASGVVRVVTDHPDLLALSGGEQGIDYVSSDAWLVEQTTPPPPPGV